MSTIYSYDVLGRLESVTMNFGPFSKSYSYTYDELGLKATYTNPEGVTYTYGFNKNSQFESLSIPGNGQVMVNEFDWNRPKKITLRRWRNHRLCPRWLSARGLL